MHAINIRKSLGHDWEDLFAIVQDIARYPQFVPCCTQVRILTTTNPTPESTEIISRMTVGLQPVQVSYTNRTLADRNLRRISVDSTDGPMRHLHVLWRFEPHGARRTDVNFAASYEFRSRLLTGLAAGVFDRLFGQMVDAFERRAGQLQAAGLTPSRPGAHTPPV